MYKNRILIVDNETSVVQTLAAVLRDEHFEVSYASDGEHALHLMHTEPPDLVLLDIWLPGMDGLETLQALKKQYAEIEVIVISGHGNIETAVKATKLGAFDYIEKPLSLERLLLTMYQALHRRTQNLDRTLLPLAQQQSSILVGDSRQIQAVRHQLEQAWQYDTAVLIQGEEGSGKALVARLLHNGSERREGPFVRCKCARLTPHNVERMLFGCIAFPDNGNNTLHKGYLEMANGGVLFLDEADHLPLEVQQKLLQAIETGAITRVGGKISIPLNVRIVASCTTDQTGSHHIRALLSGLNNLLQQNYIETPPLRTHKDDIPALTQHFLQMYGDAAPKGIDNDAMAILLRYHWPGNVKELKNLLTRIVNTTGDGCLRLSDIPPVIRGFHVLRHNSNPAESLSDTGTRYNRERHANQNHRCGQRTLRRSVVLYGQGLHSGLKTGLILSPLPPNSGILFKDITSGETVPASIEFVESTDFCTSLQKGRVTARTIEHLMSTLHAYRISNLLVKISDEIPIMDGSAAAFCQLIEEGGIEEQSTAVEEFIVDQCYHVGDMTPDAKYILVEPFDGFRVSYRLSYPKPLGVQEVLYEHRDGSSYRQDIAPARTFAFLRDVEKMHTLGLVAGGRFNNVILIDNEKIVNSVQLRFPNEFARHKVLDIIGDFYLLGGPLRGHIKANMTGHTENIALVRQLRTALGIL
jgi:two-component system nitrogen regulation response regulator NtrX